MFLSFNMSSKVIYLKIERTERRLPGAALRETHRGLLAV